MTQRPENRLISEDCATKLLFLWNTSPTETVVHSIPDAKLMTSSPTDPARDSQLYK